MPVTITYDIRADDNNHRTYIRSALERFHFRRLGGSVFRYRGCPNPATGELEEDWLNHVAPAVMFVRSYVLAKGLEIKRLTIDAASVAHIDLDDEVPFGQGPRQPEDIEFAQPTNEQSSQQALRNFIGAARDSLA